MQGRIGQLLRGPAAVATLLLGASALQVRAAVPAAVGSGGDALPSRYVLEVRKIFTGSDGVELPRVIEPGRVLVVDGRIAALGHDLEVPPGVTVFERPDLVMMPGLVLATSGIAGTASGRESVSAQFDAADGFDRFGDYRSLLMAGITTAYVGTGVDRLVSGQGCVVKLGGKDELAQVLRARAFVDVNLGDASLSPPMLGEIAMPPASDNPIQPDRPQRPESRISQISALRDAFAAAARGEGDTEGTRALVEAVASKRPLRVLADREGDILRALEFARGAGAPVTLCGLAEADEILDQLVKAKLPLIVEYAAALSDPDRGDADLAGRARGDDPLEREAETAAKLARRGLDVALSMPAGSDVTELLFAAAMTLRGGWSAELAVGALTSTPARLLGVGDRVGTLAPGRDADFLLLSDDPFRRGSHVQEVVVDGARVATREKPRKTSQATVIRAGTLYTGTGEAVRGGAEVLVRDGRVVAAGRSVGVPADARVFDFGADAVITPGLIDSNSQVEMGSDRSNFGLDMDLTRLVAAPAEESLDVARAGITTVLLQDAGARSTGSRVVPIKTAGHSRADRVLGDLCAVKFGWRGHVDPLLTVEQFRNALTAGKRYHESWLKYAADLAKWEEEQKKISPEEAKKRAADAAKKVAEVQEDVSTEKKADPVTGKWELEISGGPLPQPSEAALNLKLQGSSVSGTFVGLFSSEDDPNSVKGTLSGSHMALEFTEEIGPSIVPKLELDLGGDDTLHGALGIGDMFQLDVQGKRTEKTFEEVKVVSRRKKHDDSGRPNPPQVNEGLEPYRALFEKKAPVVLDVDFPLSIRTALDLFAKEFGLDVVLMNPTGLGDLEGYELPAAVRGVVAPPQLVTIDEGEIQIFASDVAEAGMPVALQSSLGAAARGLPLNVAYAVRRGLSPEVALAALTSEPARMFGIDDRVGSLTAGKDADLVVFRGEPFELDTVVLDVLVNGEWVQKEGVQ